MYPGSDSENDATLSKKKSFQTEGEELEVVTVKTEDVKEKKDSHTSDIMLDDNFLFQEKDVSREMREFVFSR